MDPLLRIISLGNLEMSVVIPHPGAGAEEGRQALGGPTGRRVSGSGWPVLAGVAAIGIRRRVPRPAVQRQAVHDAGLALYLQSWRPVLLAIGTSAAAPGLAEVGWISAQSATSVLTIEVLASIP